MSHDPFLDTLKEMEVALVHDYLVQDGGAERVVLAFHELYPDSPIFTLFHEPITAHPDFRGADIRPSFLNHYPLAPKHYQWYLPFMPQAIESMDLSGFDLVLSSSSSFAKGVIAAPGALHICYCHTPTRFLWQERHGYVNELPQPKIIKWFLPRFLHGLRQWDRLAAAQPDLLVTNSHTSKERIRRYYRRDATIIHPPVDIDRFSITDKLGAFWLTGGRLVAYKRFDLVVRAFAKLNLPLKIFGTGPELKKLQKIAGPKTEFLGHVPETTKAELYRDAIAFLHPHIEDFGITAIEAQACGRPLIAYGKGGATETVIPGVTGEYLEAPRWEDIGDAVIRFHPEKFDSRVIRNHAEQFSKPHFQDTIRGFIERALAEHKNI